MSPSVILADVQSRQRGGRGFCDRGGAWWYVVVVRMVVVRMVVVRGGAWYVVVRGGTGWYGVDHFSRSP